MSVVLYAGGFARYFVGGWDGAAETAPADDDGAEEATPDDVRGFFERFRDALKTELAPHVTGPLEWSEDLSAAVETVKVNEDDLGALMIIAARDAVQNKRLSPVSTKREWFDDPAVQEVQDAVEDFHPVHHLVKADAWLPGDFPFVAETEVPDRDLILGSLPQLAVARDWDFSVAELDGGVVLTEERQGEVTRQAPSQRRLTGARQADDQQHGSLARHRSQYSREIMA